MKVCEEPGNVRESYYAHPKQEDEHGVIAPWHKRQNGQIDGRPGFRVTWR